MQDRSTRVKYKQIFLTVLVIIYLSILIIVTFKYINANRYYEINGFEKNITAQSGNDIHINVKVKNKTYYMMSSKDNYFISYHLFNENGGLIQFDNARTVIENIGPGRSRDIIFYIKAPIEKGKYMIKIDIVKEGEYWFEDKGEKPGILYLTVD